MNAEGVAFPASVSWLRKVSCSFFVNKKMQKALGVFFGHILRTWDSCSIRSPTHLSLQELLGLLVFRMRFLYSNELGYFFWDEAVIHRYFLFVP